MTSSARHGLIGRTTARQTSRHAWIGTMGFGMNERTMRALIIQKRALVIYKTESGKFDPLIALASVLDPHRPPLSFSRPRSAGRPVSQTIDTTRHDTTKPFSTDLAIVLLTP